MAHPFHIAAAATSPARLSTAQDRRSFLSFVIAGVAGLWACYSTRPAAAQIPLRGNYNRRQATTLALGEEGGRDPSYRRPPRYTTRALGEEGGRYTTYALGEEGGGTATTYALGEEGSGGRVTTYALGEEGGHYYRPAPPPRPGRGTITTFALGEEG